MKPSCYTAGPMRGYDYFNFPAFDEAAEWLRDKGWDVISPAEHDRELGLDETLCPELPDWFSLENAMRFDLASVIQTDAIVLLPGWWRSEGARKEATVAMWCGRDVYFLGDTWDERDKVLIEVSHGIVQKMINEQEGYE